MTNPELGEEFIKGIEYLPSYTSGRDLVRARWRNANNGHDGFKCSVREYEENQTDDLSAK